MSETLEVVAERLVSEYEAGREIDEMIKAILKYLSIPGKKIALQISPVF